MRNTSYAREVKTTEIGTNRLERIFVHAENQEEIRLSWWPDGKMAPRPLDIPEDRMIQLLAQGIAEGVLSQEFLPKLVEQVMAALAQ